MPPPPPPPSGPPPPPAPGALKKLGGAAPAQVDRGALLKSIQQGKALKKTVTNDRSAPSLGGKSSASSSVSASPARMGGGGGGSGGGASSGSSLSNANSASTSRLPGIGGLFADGIPKLRSTQGGVQTGRLREAPTSSSTSNLRSGPSGQPGPPAAERNYFNRSTSSSTINHPNGPQQAAAPPQSSYTSSSLDFVNSARQNQQQIKPRYADPETNSSNITAYSQMKIPRPSLQEHPSPRQSRDCETTTKSANGWSNMGRDSPTYSQDTVTPSRLREKESNSSPKHGLSSSSHRSSSRKSLTGPWSVNDSDLVTPSQLRERSSGSRSMNSYDTTTTTRLKGGRAASPREQRPSWSGMASNGSSGRSSPNISEDIVTPSMLRERDALGPKTSLSNSTHHRPSWVGGEEIDLVTPSQLREHRPSPKQSRHSNGSSRGAAWATANSRPQTPNGTDDVIVTPSMLKLSSRPSWTSGTSRSTTPTQDDTLRDRKAQLNPWRQRPSWAGVRPTTSEDERPSWAYHDKNNNSKSSLNRTTSVGHMLGQYEGRQQQQQQQPLQQQQRPPKPPISPTKPVLRHTNSTPSLTPPSASPAPSSAISSGSGPVRKNNHAPPPPPPGSGSKMRVPHPSTKPPPPPAPGGMLAASGSPSWNGAGSSVPPPKPPHSGHQGYSGMNSSNNSASVNRAKSFNNQQQQHGHGGGPFRDDSGLPCSNGTPVPTPPIRTVSQQQSNANSLRRPGAPAPPPPPGQGLGRGARGSGPGGLKPPSQPPPPPPTSQPPPPPHRMQPPPPPGQPQPPTMQKGHYEAPTPPTRRHSLRNQQQGHYSNNQHNSSSGYNSSSSNSGGESFETRFQHRFKTPQFLPPPEPFTNCAKTYPSKNAAANGGNRQGNATKRQPAPPPPITGQQQQSLQLQGQWPSNNASRC